MNTNHENTNTMVAMTDIDISWHCPNQHSNSNTYCFDILPNEDVDFIVEDFCSDEINQEENPCHECGELGFYNVSWNYNRDDLLELINNNELIVLSPAA